MKPKLNRAVILAGGKGVRLKPYTTVLPKSLMPVGDFPILEIVIRRLKQCGINHITLTVNHLADIVKAFCGTGEKWGVHIDYAYEDRPLGTAGPLNNIAHGGAPFIVMNGDVLTTLDFRDLFRFHEKRRPLVTVTAFAKRVPTQLGVLKVNGASSLRDYIEKPVMDFLVSTGIYVFEPAALKYIRKGERIDMPDFLKRLLKRKQRVVCYPLKGLWLDIGTPEDYEEAQATFKSVQRSLKL